MTYMSVDTRALTRLEAVPGDRLKHVHMQAVLGITYPTIRGYIQSGRVPAPHVIGGDGLAYWNKCDVEAWLRNGMPACTPPTETRLTRPAAQPARHTKDEHGVERRGQST
jgi:predicted DNA-binding transcriptional regulator AlpA